MSARGPAFLRNINRFDVLQTIRLHDNQISRSELSEMTGLSQATISSIVGHLIEEGALIEDDACGLAAKGRGRPLVMLRLNPEYTHVVGVKIATHRIDFSVTDFVGNVAASDNIPADALKIDPSAADRLCRSRCPSLSEKGRSNHRRRQWHRCRFAWLHRFSPRDCILESCLRKPRR